jgi:hypothetical protein
VRFANLKKKKIRAPLLELLQRDALNEFHNPRGESLFMERQSGVKTWEDLSRIQVLDTVS